MAQDTCTIQGCETISVCRGWCRHHYNQQYKGKPLTQVITTVKCNHCGQAMPQGRNRLYCSQQCREVVQYKMRRANTDGWAAYLERRRKEYVKKTEQPGYQRPTKERTPCAIEDCDRISTSRAMCVMHYKRWARANGYLQSPSDKWTDARRSNSHARRARMNGGSTGDRVLMADLFLRDGAACASCGEHVDVDIPWPEPYSPSVDHTIPLSKGGAHIMENCTIMHLRCNIIKGARLDSEENESATQQPPSSQVA